MNSIQIRFSLLALLLFWLCLVEDSQGAEWAVDKWHSRPAQTTVAVIDSGVDLNHPRLVSLLTQGYNFGDCNPLAIPECSPGSTSNPQDLLGHGTLVAGIVASLSREHSVKILPIKVNPGMMDDFTAGALAASIKYAASKGARVINISMEMQSLSENDRRTVAAALDSVLSDGVIVVVCAGNRGSALTFPASHPGVIAVGGISAKGYPLVGPSSANGVKILAPAFVADGLGLHGRDGVSAVGTSVSAPQATAAVAVLLSICPRLSPSEILTILMVSKDRLESTRGVGSGLLNLSRAFGVASLRGESCGAGA